MKEFKAATVAKLPHIGLPMMGWTVGMDCMEDRGNQNFIAASRCFRQLATYCICITHGCPCDDASFHDLFGSDSKICRLPQDEIGQLSNADITDYMGNTVCKSTVYVEEG